MAEWVQDALLTLSAAAGWLRADRLGSDVLRQLPAPAWSGVVTVELPDAEVIAARLAGVGR